MKNLIKKVLIIIIISICAVMYFFAPQTILATLETGTKEIFNNTDLLGAVSSPSNKDLADVTIEEHYGYSYYVSKNDYVHSDIKKGIPKNKIKTIVEDNLSKYSGTYPWLSTLQNNTSVFCQEYGQALPSTWQTNLESFHRTSYNTNECIKGSTVSDVVEYFYGRGCDKSISILETKVDEDGDPIEAKTKTIKEKDIDWTKKYTQETRVRVNYSYTWKDFDTKEAYILSYSEQKFYREDRAQVAMWIEKNERVVDHANYTTAEAVANGKNLAYTAKAVDDLKSPIKPTITKGSNIGTVISGDNYKIGPIVMSNYTYGWSEYAKKYSGELICGIIGAQLTLDSVDGDLNKTIILGKDNFEFIPTAQDRSKTINIVTTGTTKGNVTVWRAPSVSNDEYIYPTPGATFYILIPISSCKGATKVENITMTYKYTTAEGNGWDLNGTFKKLTWEATLNNSHSSCTYDCDMCHNDNLSFDARSATENAVNEKTHAYWCGATGYCFDGVSGEHRHCRYGGLAWGSYTGEQCISCPGHKGDMDCNGHHSHTTACCSITPTHDGHTCSYTKCKGIHSEHTSACCSITATPHADHKCNGGKCPYGGLHSKHTSSCCSKTPSHADHTCNSSACAYGGTHTWTDWSSASSSGCYGTDRCAKATLNYCVHGHKSGHHSNGTCTGKSWGADHTDACDGGTSGTKCDHNHTTCYGITWTVIEEPKTVKSQTLIAVNNAKVIEHKTECYIENIPLVTKVDINKYIYDVNHSVTYNGYDSTMSKSTARSSLTEENKQKNPVYVEYGDLVTYRIDMKNHSAFDIKIKIEDIIPKDKASSIYSVKVGTDKLTAEGKTPLELLKERWIEIDAGKTATCLVTVKVEKTNGTYENLAKMITRNGSDGIDYIRTQDDNGPIVNHVTVKCNGTKDEPKQESKDFYILNDYNATLDKYISSYDAKMTANNNQDGFTSEILETNEDGTLINRYDMTEEQKQNRPLAVEKTERIVYAVRVTNESKAGTTNSVYGATKKQTTVRPTKITDSLQTGLKYVDSYARIYKSDGKDKYNINIPVVEKALENNMYTCEIPNSLSNGKIIMLDPGEYLVYYITVEVTESNMYLYNLANTATLNTLTNVNDVRQIINNKVTITDKREVQNSEGVNENKSTQQVSTDYVKMKDLVIAGKVWLDVDEDGLMDLNSEKKFGQYVDAGEKITIDKPYVNNKTEYAMKNIVVKLYSVGTAENGGDTLVRTTKTDAEGSFTFGKQENGSSWYNGTYSYKDGVTESEQRIDKATNKDANKNYTNSSKLIQYYIEYEYDGIVYRSTDVYSGKNNLESTGAIKNDKYYIDSNATEFKSRRDTFDSNHEIVAFNKAYSKDLNGQDALSYDKTEHKSILKQDNERGKNNGGIMTARSFVNVSNQTTDYLWLYKQGSDYSLPETEYLKYINLGLMQREDIDIKLTQDVYEVKTSINGEQMTYEYNQNNYTLGNSHIDKEQEKDASGNESALSKQYNSEFYITGYISDTSPLLPYELKIYNSDYEYKVDKYTIDTVKNYKGTESELNVETTFRIKVTNSAITNDIRTDKDVKVYTGINEIVEYYDTEFMDLVVNPDGTVKTINIKTKDEKGYLVNTPINIVKAEYVMNDGTRKEATLSTSSPYNTTRTITDKDGNALYSTLYIRPKISEGQLPLTGDIIIGEGESIDILITFSIDKDSARDIYLGDKINVAEISAYSTYYKNEDGTYYAAGLVDQDSNPGNFGEKYSLVAEKTVDSQEYLKLYEDDTFKTGINILLQEISKERILSGFVWDDARTEKTGTNGTQYLGDGRYNTSKNAETLQPEAKRNPNVSNKEKEDIAIKDMKVEMVEQIAIPERDAEGNVLKEKVYEQTIKVSDDETLCITSTRTGEDGKYTIKGYIPGNYVVRFKYGDDTRFENMLIFNGQDYKSTTYQAGEAVYAENESNPDKVLEILEKPNISDAKDDEIARLDTISYSETMTNKLNEILRGKNSTDKEELTANTNMISDTAEFLVKTEREMAGKNVLTYAETMNKFKEAQRYPIKNIDFGIEYRPELQVALSKYISNVKIVTSDETGEGTKTPLVDAVFKEYYGIVLKTDIDSGATEFLEDENGEIIKVPRYASNADVEKAVEDAIQESSEEFKTKIRQKFAGCKKSDDGKYIVTLAGTELDEANSVGLMNLQYVENEFARDAHGNLFLYDSNGYVKADQGFVYLNIDDEIMQGASVTIKYVFAASNLSEIDRVSSNLSVLRFKENDEARAYRVEGKYYDQVKIQLGENTGYIDEDYSAAKTARNKLFSEYYGYEINPANTEDPINKDSNGNKIIYRIKDRNIDVDGSKKINTDQTYYGRYLGSLYYTGVIGNKDVVAELKIDKILDYIDNDLVFDNTQNNGTNNLWKTTTSQELYDSGLININVFKKVKMDDKEDAPEEVKLVDSNNIVYDTKERSNLAILLDDRIKDYANPADDKTVNKDISKYLTPRYANGAESFGLVNLVASKVIAAEESTENMTYENIGEIIQYSSVTGRVTSLATTIGNAKFFDNSGNPEKEWDEARKESDTAATEKVTLTPPTGLGKVEQIVRDVVENTSYTLVVVFIVSLVCVTVLGIITLYRKRRIK